MPETKCSITYAGRETAFRLIYTKRKSLEIAVYPNGSVAVKAPLGTDESVVARRVQKRAGWIRKQIDYFSQFEPRQPKRRFVSGESHFYLGRKYRLKVRQSGDESVALRDGFFHIAVCEKKPENVSNLLDKWYREKAEIYFRRVFERCWDSFERKGAEKPVLKIRSMKTRWGSLSSKGSLTLNLRLIQSPGECVEYVVIHELCHLIHKNHGAKFYELQEAVLPDWASRKQKLERTLA